MLGSYQIKVIRRRLAYQQDWKCWWCGGEMNNELNDPLQVSLDHKIPKHAGGEDRHDNYCAAHRKCNSERHPEMEQRKADAPALVATTGETPGVSPFAVLKEKLP